MILIFRIILHPSILDIAYISKSAPCRSTHLIYHAVVWKTHGLISFVSPQPKKLFKIWLQCGIPWIKSYPYIPNMIYFYIINQAENYENTIFSVKVRVIPRWRCDHNSFPSTLWVAFPNWDRNLILHTRPWLSIQRLDAWWRRAMKGAYNSLLLTSAITGYHRLRLLQWKEAGYDRLNWVDP